MRFSSMWRPVLLGAVVSIFAATAHAQGSATNFDQLSVLVQSGDRLTVTGASGGVVEGRVLDLTSSTLTLQVDGQPRQFLLDDVRTISRQQHADVGKGAAWGFGVGAGLALVGYAQTGGCSSCGAVIVAGTVMTGAIGAGIGAVFATATVHDHVIFSKPGTANVKLSAGPIVDRNHRGVMLTARW
jgi:hypothetical protein